jgi:hypothetical protein
MLMYNLYYNNEKINALPISLQELEELKKREYVGKVNNVTKEITKIPTKELNIIKCYLV